MEMNSGKSMDDILDSIRRIVNEEETGESAPKRETSRSEAEKREGGDVETLILTREMRVDQDATLNLSPSEQVSDEELEAIAALRLVPSAGAAEEDAREAVASLRMDRGGRDQDEAREEIAAFDAALADDDLAEDFGDGFEDEPEDAPEYGVRAADVPAEAEEETEADAPKEVDEYGFAIPEAEHPLKRKRDEFDEPRHAGGFSLRLNRSAPEPEAAEDAAAPESKAEDAPEAESEATGETIFLGAAAELDEPEIEEETRAEGLAEPGSRAEIERLVRSAVREELSGALGDKITRNIRGMVRREIQRVMETKQIK